MKYAKGIRNINNVTRKILTVSLVVFPSYAISQGAMVVTDPGAYLKMAEEISNLQEQIELAESQLKSAEQSLKQLDGGQYQWSDAQGVINDLGNTINKANGLSYNAANIDQQFKAHYPGYQSAENYSESYKAMTNKTQNTLNGVLQSVGGSADNFTNEQNRLKFLQAQSQSAQGQTQAIQAASQIASEQVTQLHLLRQTLIAQTNAQTTFYAHQIQKEASAEAELREIMRAGSTSSPGIGKSGYQLNIPEFK